MDRPSFADQEICLFRRICGLGACFFLASLLQEALAVALAAAQRPSEMCCTASRALLLYRLTGLAGS